MGDTWRLSPIRRLVPVIDIEPAECIIDGRIERIARRWRHLITRDVEGPSDGRSGVLRGLQNLNLNGQSSPRHGQHPARAQRSPEHPCQPGGPGVPGRMEDTVWKMKKKTHYQRISGRYRLWRLPHRTGMERSCLFDHPGQTGLPPGYDLDHHLDKDNRAHPHRD